MIRKLAIFLVRLACGAAGCVLAGFLIYALPAPFTDVWFLALASGAICGALLEIAATGSTRPWRSAVALPSFYFLTCGPTVMVATLFPRAIYAPAAAFILGSIAFVALVAWLRRVGDAPAA